MRSVKIVLGLVAAAGAISLAFLGGGRLGGPPTTVERASEADEQVRGSRVGTAQTEFDLPTEPDADSGQVQPSEPLSEQPTAGGASALNAILGNNGAALLELASKEAAQELRHSYSILFDQLGLPAEQQDALLALLVEQQLAGTRIISANGSTFQDSNTVDMNDRSDKIAVIVGDARREEFLKLERNLAAYSEAQSIATLLKKNDAPLTIEQRDDLVGILIATTAQASERPNTVRSTDRTSLDYLAQRLADIDEHQRHVMELATSALTPAQVVYLDEQYHYMSYRRAEALEAQREQASKGTAPFLVYPAWDD